MLLDISRVHLAERNDNAEKVKIANPPLFIKQGTIYHKVKIEDILYLESENIYIHVHTVNKKFLVRSNLSQYVELLDSQDFFRVHRSFVININHVQTIEPNHIFINNKTIPIGKTYREDLLNSLRLG